MPTVSDKKKEESQAECKKPAALVGLNEEQVGKLHGLVDGARIIPDNW